MIDSLFAWVVKHRNHLVSVFKFFFLAQTLVLCIGGWSVYMQDDRNPAFYSVGRASGEYAIVFFILTSLPGIFRRFGIRSKLASILMTFRRYFGIACYLFVLIHSSFVQIIPWVALQVPVFPMELYAVMGVTAHFFLFALFITSNDYSIKRLGIRWDRLHDFTYIIVWLIFLHVALLGRFTVYTFLIGSTAMLQVASHVFVHLYRKT